MKEAFLYTPLPDKQVRCDLCAHRCRIPDGERGFCTVRENRDGMLYTLSYDRVVATAIDPIEKKPLYHFKPGSRSYSIATVGCNFVCDFCQNHHISQYLKDQAPVPPGEAISPEVLAKHAARSGCATIAFTYTEPTIFAELAFDVATHAKEAGIASLFISNGFMSPELLTKFSGLIAGANIDLKCFREESYRRTTGGRLKPVLENIERLRTSGVWLEVTTLLVPGFNDSEAEVTEIARFLASLSPDIPWHLSAFRPQYRMTDRSETDPETLRRAYELAREAGLRYVYLGNLRSLEGSITRCSRCNENLIERHGFHVQRNVLVNGSCPRCRTQLPGVF